MPATKKAPKKLTDSAKKNLESYLWELERTIRTLNREAGYCRDEFKKDDSDAVKKRLGQMSNRMVVIHQMIRETILSAHAAYGVAK